ncbi:pantoate--beta-alanine ligase [Chondromyces apiculatus]|uniref:Pantothenate synthetase n=1 Tax=Chondromyces apiculatus DSM 436 TaxID=1192034 RepID=A0A017SWA9_9BACT|nr:pantoate--beta-alanine ligase [Chondromyces apiculatus]EYF01278.1 Pantoate--beta-alanine ligase [Chondromyces apiculatus DSM 436]
MELRTDPEEFRRACEEARAGGARVGLVPTMGALHEGHLTLIGEARKRAPFVAVTLFVNPTQFAPGEDFARYPRTLERDSAACEAAGASVLFAPEVSTMYPPGEETRVHPGATAAPLCGAHRPGHFEGVATVVTKLFALAGPCVAVFGRKDYQQLMVIRRLVRDLLLPVEVVGIPTVRESDGLALSSRNTYLSPEDRRRAAEIPHALAEAARAFEAGERRAGTLVARVRARLARISDRIDYIDVAEPESLRVLGAEEHAGERALLALALRVGTTRLIDNLVLGEDSAPRVGDASPGPASASASAEARRV